MSEGHRKERLLALLFEQEGSTLVDIKFFRGDADVISEEELCAQVHSALLQRRTGIAKASKVFQEDPTAIDVAQFVAAI